MNIEEKAKEIIPDAFYDDIILPAREGYIVDQQRLYFKVGAEWMLKKACEYIRSQYPVHYQEWYELAEERVKQFKKAMEE